MTVIGDPRKAGESGPAGDQRKAGESGPAGDPRPAGVEKVETKADEKPAKKTAAKGSSKS